MEDFQQNHVSRTVWPWMDADGNAAESGSLPRRAAVQAVIMCAIASVLFFLLHHHVMPVIILVLATIVVLSAFFAPALFHGIDRFGKALGQVVGIILTWMLLIPFFYICFTVGRLLLVVLKVDPMRRKAETGEDTCWVQHPERPPLDRYGKRF
ncbi:MAG: hypothetical protein QGH15_01450 [Kiritimatiellia bacterium]|nr:hypothetical protein [Kiritimatiellia bacterium]